MTVESRMAVAPVRDIAAIGCGPFNLGLAALASTVKGLDLVAFDECRELSWHSGLMFADARLQLSFIADLVSLVDPTHPLSFLAYLRDVDRLYHFYVRETFHPTRREYEAYLRWVLAKLPSVRLSHRVEAVSWDERQRCFAVQGVRSDGSELRVWAKNLVLGLGTEPAVPACVERLPHDRLIHSAHYLFRAAELPRAGHVTVLGSGQSGAEIMLDLLRTQVAGGPELSWFTRTRSFAPLDYTKLVLEMTTPDYIRYFHGLPQAVKDRLVLEQWQHYKGISSETLQALHEALYERELQATLAPVELRCGAALESAQVACSGRVVLTIRDRDTNVSFTRETDVVVAATGYRERRPECLSPLGDRVLRDDRGRFRVRADYSLELHPSIGGRIFVSNADLHSHGVAAPDLGTSAFRNATILNAIVGREVYRLPRRTAFTSFGPPTEHRTSASAPAARSGASREASEATEWP